MHLVSVAPKAPSKLLEVTRSLYCFKAFDFVDFQWGNFLVHPLDVAPKAPSSFLKLLGVLYFKEFAFYRLPVGALLSAPTGCSPQGSE